MVNMVDKRVRNCAEIGENLIRIIDALMHNKTLIKLLYNETMNPLEDTNIDNFTDEQYEDFLTDQIYEKLIKIVPRIGPKEDAKSIVALQVSEGTKLLDNSEFKNVEVVVSVFVPTTQWLIKGRHLRPFAILGEVQSVLDGLVVNGLGQMRGGDFKVNFLTDEMTCYEQFYNIVAYD